MNQIVIPVRTSRGFLEIEIVRNSEGIPVVTSLNVAEVFGKEHKHVLRDIESLDCSDEFRQSNFGLSSYKPAGAKRSYPMYEMTRDGFTFLAMGFTGSTAAQFKEGYIRAFNQMEAHIKQSQVIALPNFNNPVEAARAWADQCEQRLALEAQNQIMLPKAQKYDRFMDADGTVDLTRAAKALNFPSARALGEYLRKSLDWLFATTKHVTPKAHVIEKGYMVSKLWANEGKHSGSHGRITAKGMEYLMNHFSKEA